MRLALDAAIAIETVLGLNPQGSEPTVNERLNTIEGAISTLATDKVSKAGDQMSGDLEITGTAKLGVQSLGSPQARLHVGSRTSGNVSPSAVILGDPNNTADIGDYAVVEGEQNSAIGQRAHAEGYQTIASGINSHAEGDQTIASGINSHAEGSSNTAEGLNSHASGFDNIVRSNEGTVFGAHNSIGFGAQNFAAGSNNTVQNGATQSSVFGIGNTVGASSQAFVSGAANVIESGASQAAVFGSNNTVHPGGQSFVAGSMNEVGFNGNSTVFGLNNTVLYGNSLFVFGASNNVNSAFSGIVGGYGNQVGVGGTAAYSAVFGLNNTVGTQADASKSLVCGTDHKLESNNTILGGQNHEVIFGGNNAVFGQSNRVFLSDGVLIGGVSNTAWNRTMLLVGETNNGLYEGSTVSGIECVGGGVGSVALGVSSVAGDSEAVAIGINNTIGVAPLSYTNNGTNFSVPGDQTQILQDGMTVILYGYSGGTSKHGKHETNINSVSFNGVDTTFSVNSLPFGYNHTSGKLLPRLSNSARASVAIGENNKILARDSVALGYGNTIYGQTSFAMGQDNIIGAIENIGSLGSYVFGRNNIVDGLSVDSFVCGDSNNLTNTSYSAIFGRDNSITSGEGSVVIGGENVVNGSNNGAFGYLCQVTNTGAFAFGRENITSGINAFAFGISSTASGDYSVAMGSGADTNLKEGSFVLADSTRGLTTTADEPNQFKARFNNGFKLVKGDSLTLTDGVEYEIKQANVLTTDSTPTILQDISIPNDTVVLIEARVLAGRIGGTAGTPGDCAAYIIRARYKNIGGVVTIHDVVTEYESEDNMAWGATLVTDTLAAQIQVTGAVDNNINWNTTTKIQKLYQLS
jgi:hypothetical protein